MIDAELEFHLKKDRNKTWKYEDGILYYRVRLPGEKAWAEVISKTKDKTSFKGRIDSMVGNSLHDYWYDDYLTFIRTSLGWEPKLRGD